MVGTMQHIDAQRKATIRALHQNVIGRKQCDMSDAAQYSKIGERLASVRAAFSDLDQKAWAEKHGFQRGQYNSWERGVRRIPVEHAEKLADLYGLDLDFVYRGKRDGLSERASKVL